VKQLRVIGSSLRIGRIGELEKEGSVLLKGISSLHDAVPV